MSVTLEIPMFQPRPRPKFKRKGEGVVAYYDDTLGAVREAVAEQWTAAPLAGRVALEAEFRVALPMRVSKARRAAMLAGEIRPKLAGKTVDDYLRDVVDCLEGTVFPTTRALVRLSGFFRYGEAAGATLRVGEVQLLAM